MKKLIYLIPLFIFSWSCLPQEEPDNAPQTVDYVDVEQYLGKWYEIASYPQIFELGCVCVTANYSLKENGDVGVTNKCTLLFPGGPPNNISGSASVIPNSGNAKLNVTFFGQPMDDDIGNYWIIGLADDYSWALISDPFRNTFWILSRTPQMEDSLYDELIDMAVDMGFQRNKIEKMNQGC